MILGFDFWNAVLRQVNTWQTGFMRPEDFVQWTNEANTTLFNMLFGELWEKNRVVDTKLGKPFYKTVNLTVSAQDGKPYDKILYPADFGYLDKATLQFRPETTEVCGCGDQPYVDGCTGEPTAAQSIDVCKALTEEEMIELRRNSAKGSYEYAFEKVTTDRWSAATQHPRRKATFLKPKMCLIEGGFKIAPKDVGVITFNYFKKPVKFTFVYTIGANDSIQFVSSSNLEWDESVQDVLVRLVGQQFAKFTGNQELYAMLDKEIESLMK